MTTLPLWVKAALAAALLTAIWRAHFGPPPAHPNGRRAAFWVAAAVGHHALAVAGLVADAWFAAPALALGVICWCAAAWNVRGDEGDEGGGGGEEGPDQPGPIDWDAFDRARAGWGRPRVPA